MSVCETCKQAHEICKCRRCPLCDGWVEDVICLECFAKEKNKRSKLKAERDRLRRVMEQALKDFRECGSCMYWAPWIEWGLANALGLKPESKDFDGDDSEFTRPYRVALGEEEA